MGFLFNKALNANNRGVSIVEVGLIIAIVVVVVITVLTGAGSQACRTMMYVATAFEADGTINMTYRCGCSPGLFWNCYTDDSTGEINCACARRL